MGSATQKVGGPLLNTFPGVTIGTEATPSWTFYGQLIVTNTDASSSETTGSGLFYGGIAVRKTSQFGLNTGECLIRINGGAGSARGLRILTANVTTWNLFADTTAHSGGDAGSVLIVRAVSDGGGTIDNPAEFLRPSGAAITFGGSTKRSVVTTGGRVVSITVATDDINLNTTHHSVVCNKGTAMTVNLPAVASNTGREYIISNKGAGVVTVDANASELIDNATTQALNQWQSITIHSDGSIWKIVG